MTAGNPAHMQRGLGANGAIAWPEVRRFPRSAGHALLGIAQRRDTGVFHHDAWDLPADKKDIPMLIHLIISKR